MGRDLERAADRDSALLLGSGRETGKSDYVADRVNVIDAGLVVRIGFQTAARVGGDARGGEVQVAGGADAAGAGQGFVGDELLAAGQAGAHAIHAVLADQLDRRNFFTQAKRHAPFAQMVDQAFDNFRIDEIQQPRAHIYQRHSNAERREHARVFASDDAGADDCERAWELVELHHVVAGKDAVAVERGALVAGRVSAHGEHDSRGGNLSLQAARFVFEVKDVRIDEAGARGHQLDAVAQELMAQDVDLVAHDRIDADQQILERDFFLDPVRIAVDCVLTIAREVHDGFAHRLARNRADVDADTAEERLAFNHNDALAQLGALDGRMMAGGSGAYDSKVEIKLWHRFHSCDLHDLT